MSHQRSREEVAKLADDFAGHRNPEGYRTAILRVSLEVLLDIRDNTARIIEELGKIASPLLTIDEDGKVTKLMKEAGYTRPDNDTRQ